MLTLDDLGQVLEELQDVRDRWYRLGLQLKVNVGALETIREKCSDSRDWLLEMLKTWLTASDNTSWRVLTDALRSRSVGADWLTGDLERKYSLTKDMHESKH